jgi:hypothetical protein
MWSVVYTPHIYSNLEFIPTFKQQGREDAYTQWRKKCGYVTSLFSQGILIFTCAQPPVIILHSQLSPGFENTFFLCTQSVFKRMSHLLWCLFISIDLNCNMECFCSFICLSLCLLRVWREGEVDKPKRIKDLIPLSLRDRKLKIISCLYG